MAFGPAAESAIRPASRIAAPLMSADLATWPFLRASSRFLGVAFSVLFSAIALRDLQRVQHLGDGVLEGAIEEVVRDERERGAEQDQADDQLRGEADREHVHLRPDARDDAERGVGDDEGEDDR